MTSRLIANSSLSAGSKTTTAWPESRSVMTASGVGSVTGVSWAIATPEIAPARKAAVSRRGNMVFLLIAFTVGNAMRRLAFRPVQEFQAERQCRMQGHHTATDRIAFIEREASLNGKT